jgi:hypothetical protein
LGLGTITQLVPFHRSTSVTYVPEGLSKELPTAKQLLILVHDTLDSPRVLGLGTIAQLVPFHRSTSAPPTAKQLVVLVHDTDSPPPGLGLGTITNGGPTAAGGTCDDAEAGNGTATPAATSTITATTNGNPLHTPPRTLAPITHMTTSPRLCLKPVRVLDISRTRPGLTLPTATLQVDAQSERHASPLSTVSPTDGCLSSWRKCAASPSHTTTIRACEGSDRAMCRERISAFGARIRAPEEAIWRDV